MTTRTVPLEPTEEMIDAAFAATVWPDLDRTTSSDVMMGLRRNMIKEYKAMIHAAPAEPDPAADPVQMKHGRWNLADDGFGVQSADDGVYCYYADAQERVRELEVANLNLVENTKSVEAAFAGMTERAEKAEADNKRLRDRHDDQGRWYREAIKQVKDQFAAERDALAKDAERYRWLRDDKYWADICRPVHGNDCEHVAGVELDSVIDAAIISGRDAT